MNDQNTPPAPDPQAAYDARCGAIDALVDSLPGYARAFALEHLDAVRQADRLRAAHLGYVLQFVEGVCAMARPAPPPPPRVADDTHMGRGL